MSISVGGLMSGLDTDSIIEQLVQLERRPILQLQQREAGYQLKLSTYGSLAGSLAGLQAAVKGLNQTDDFAKFNSTSSETDIFTVSAGSDAVPGSYSITVHSLAQAHKLTSSGFGETDAVGEGTLTIQVGSGDAITIDVTDGDTIQDVADAINAEKGDVAAGLIYDGSDYYLQLTAAETGEANVIQITVDDTGDGNDTDTNGLSRLAFEKGVTENLIEYQTAADATIDVDGITGIKRASNTVDDVISGVTINLVTAHGNPATDSTRLTIGRDTTTIISAVDTFISAYNTVAGFLNANQGYNEDSGAGGPLLGDTTARLVQRRLSTILNTTFSGMDTISRLSNLGISRDDDGNLERDTSTLTELMDTDFDGIVQFFTQTTTGEEGFAVRMFDELDAMSDSTNGTITARQEGIQRSIDDIQKSVERMEMRIRATESRMRAQFNALELLLSEYQTTGNFLTQQIDSLQNLNTAIANR